jgi:hypothetical protein
MTAAYCVCPAVLRLEATDDAGNVTQTLDLMDQANGYRVDSLDLGWPAVREVVALLPTRDGDYDTTSLFGSRIVTVTGSFVPSPAGSRYAALRALSWWLQPALRPRIVYQVDADLPPVLLGLRGSQLAAPMSDVSVTAFTASWVAPDPTAYGETPNQAVIVPGLTVSGRNYPRTYPRTYTGTGGSGLGSVVNAGNFHTWPTFKVWGPCVGPAIYYEPPAVGQWVFTGDLSVAAGDYVLMDTQAATVLYNGDPAASRYSTLDFTQTMPAPLLPGATGLRFAPMQVSGACQLEIDWSDAYLP